MYQLQEEEDEELYHPVEIGVVNDAAGQKGYTEPLRFMDKFGDTIKNCQIDIGASSVSWGQCHLNHLTILRRFSWPSLAYMCTKVA